MSIKIASFEITIDGNAYQGIVRQENDFKNPFEMKPPGDVETRRLTLAVMCYTTDKGSDTLIATRTATLKTAFAHSFPDAPKFVEESGVHWKFTQQDLILYGARREHIRWAQAAKECGLIDLYLVEDVPVKHAQEGHGGNH